MRVPSQKKVKTWGKMDKCPSLVQTIETVMENGVPVQKVVIRELEEVDVRSNFIDRDLSLNSLIASGAIGALKEVGLVKPGSMEAIDTLVANAPDVDYLEAVMNTVQTSSTEPVKETEIENKTEE